MVERNTIYRWLRSIAVVSRPDAPVHKFQALYGCRAPDRTRNLSKESRIRMECIYIDSPYLVPEHRADPSFRPTAANLTTVRKPGKQINSYQVRRNIRESS